MTPEEVMRWQVRYWLAEAEKYSPWDQESMWYCLFMWAACRRAVRYGRE